MRYTSDEIEALRELTATEGWSILVRYAEEVVGSNLNNLMTVDATDTAKIATLQGEIRGMKRVFEHVRMALRRNTTEED